MLIAQDPSRPNVVLGALRELASPETSRFRVLAAYVTVSGCALLVPALEAEVGARWSAIPKVIVTSFDFGITEPDALEYLETAGFAVRIANLGAQERVVIIPSASAFHPKAYIFDAGGSITAVVGSANLTRRALTVNAEAAYVGDDLGEAVEEQWQMALTASTPLTPAILQRYREKRPAALARSRPPVEPVPPAEAPDAAELKAFFDAVENGEVDPREFEAFWVQADRMSGGSGNQLELPRGGNTFFGFEIPDYDSDQRVIGEPLLVIRGTPFEGRKLTWHGHNGMERINLPTRAQSGLAYDGTAVLFRRLEEGFRLEVRPWDSAEAGAWRAESAAAGHLFRLGHGSPRLCGLL